MKKVKLAYGKFIGFSSLSLNKIIITFNQVIVFKNMKKRITKKNKLQCKQKHNVLNLNHQIKLIIKALCTKINNNSLTNKIFKINYLQK